VTIQARDSSLMDLRQVTPQPLRTLAGVFTIGVMLLVWWYVTSGAVAEQRLLADLNARIRAVSEGPDGSLYVLTDGANGRILRLVRKG